MRFIAKLPPLLFGRHTVKEKVTSLLVKEPLTVTIAYEISMHGLTVPSVESRGGHS